MHSFSNPWIFGTRSRSWKDWYKFFTDMSKFSRRWVLISGDCSMCRRAFSTCSRNTCSSSAITITS